MQLISSVYSRGHIANKTFKRAASTENANEQIARIDFGQSTGREFEHVVSRAVSQCPDNNDVTSARRTCGRNKRHSFRELEWRGRGANLVDVDHFDVGRLS